MSLAPEQTASKKIASEQTALESTLAHLEALVSFDTQNPPRAITVDSEIFAYLKQQLSGFAITMFDAGEGCISLLAVRGKPEILFNFHIDTVPVAPNWSVNPFTLIVDDKKATAIGACDIKGAAACMLSAVAKTPGDVALLFSSDEEHGSSTAIKQFLTIIDTVGDFKQVIVAEPTQAKAVLAHRGIMSAKGYFSGISGHASEARAFKDSAIHKAGNWMSSALQWVEQQTQSVDSLSGLPFNIGKIDGGIKANMIAADCELAFGFRPLPGQDAQQVLADLQQLADCKLLGGFSGPTLPAANQNFALAISNANALAQSCHLPIGNAVNFWTEASLFSQAGCTTLVFGPGNIAQAHTADEWVELDQLTQVEAYYCQILNGSAS
ncbi:MAG: acetylornithine deacetylase [Alteromonadaceae bacterium]|jgi:acetylornithine deacetylase